MTARGNHVEVTRQQLGNRISHALPHLTEIEVHDVERIAHILIRTFQPYGIYVFGSYARHTPHRHSDLDLFVVVPDAGQYPHHLAQQAYRAIGPHILPLDILFMSREEFDWRTDVITSLPARVLKEGRLLYDAGSA